jgi:hypothetical protein
MAAQQEIANSGRPIMAHVQPSSAPDMVSRLQGAMMSGTREDRLVPPRHSATPRRVLRPPRL